VISWAFSFEQLLLPTILPMPYAVL
jgi:hypothetical protein